MNVQDAEAALSKLEDPRQRYHNARHDHATLADELARAQEKHAGRPKMLAALQEEHDLAYSAHQDAKAEHEAHVQRFQDKGVDLSREIDHAAQAVLDARGEKHTETGIKGPETDEEKSARNAADKGE
jgi:predicted  nucleic acid-binding Zn-ribbon protein